MSKRAFWLFSYGSNSPEQLAYRLGHAVVAVPAWTNGWRRVYRGHSRKWSGGVGSLEPAMDTVLGSAAKVDETDLGILDLYEGVPRNYFRATIPIYVIGDDGEQQVEAAVYLSTATEGALPCRQYLEAIAENINSVWKKSNGKPYRAIDFAPTVTESQ